MQSGMMGCFVFLFVENTKSLGKYFPCNRILNGCKVEKTNEYEIVTHNYTNDI